MAGIKIHSLKFNFAMNLILTGSSVLFPLITFPIVSRALYSDAYGLCNWAISITSWFSLVGMLGVNRYGVRAVARARDDINELSKVTKGILLVTCISTLISLVCFIISLILVDKFSQNRILLLINSITIICNTVGVNWFFQGIEQYSYITIRGILVKIACLIGVVLLVHTPNDYLVYAGLVVAASAVANIINFFYMFYILKRSSMETKFESEQTQNSFSLWMAFQCFKIAIKEATIHVKPLLTFFLITAAISIYTMLDTTMLGFLNTDREVGYYTAAINVKAALVAIISALTGVLLPRASNMIAQRKYREYYIILKKCILVTFTASIAIGVFVALFATPLISWYAGEDFAGSGPVLSIVALAVIPIGLSIIFCDAILIPFDKEKYCMVIYALAAIIDFTGNLILIPTYGAVGAAISTLIVEIFIVCIELVLVVKLAKSNRLRQISNC